MSFFNYLDKSGGFFYERWGDAPVHSIAVALFLDKSEVEYFENIGEYLLTRILPRAVHTLSSIESRNMQMHARGLDGL